MIKSVHVCMLYVLYVWLDFPASADSRKTGGNLDMRFFTASLSSPFRVLFHSTLSEWLPSDVQDSRVVSTCGPKMSPSPTSTYWEPAVTIRSTWSCFTRPGQTVRPPVRFQARLTLCQRWKKAFPSARETRGVSGNAEDHTGSLCASGMCKCNQHVYVNLRFVFMHLDALSVYMLWERSTVCAEYSQEEHTIKKIPLCYKIHITSVNKWKCIWSVHLTWLFYQVQHLCINDSYVCYCRSDALFSSVGPENSHIYRPEDQEWLVSCQTGGKPLETTQNDPKTPSSSHSLKKPCDKKKYKL